MNRFTIRLAVFALTAIPAMSSPAALNKLGAMGDSLTDEYWDSGVSSYATNWPDQLVIYRGIGMGPTAAQAGVGAWGAPRNAGYEYNWALSGATSASLLSDGQDTGLAGQVATNGVSDAVLEIGSNDFNPETTAYISIYFDSWSAAQVQTYVNQSISNIETALVAVKAVGANVVVANLIDPGPTPAVAAAYTSASSRARVTAAVQSVNAGIKNLGQKYQVPVMDWYGFETALLGPNSSLHSTAKVGNVTINLRESDPGPPASTPTAGFVSDGFHPNTVVQGALANLILQAFDSGYGDKVSLFTDQEILSHAQIPYGGSETLQKQIGVYSNFVILPVQPRLASVGIHGTNLSLGLSAATNQSVIIEKRDDLASGLWTPVATNASKSGGAVNLTLANEFSTGVSGRFYRLRQGP